MKMYVPIEIGDFPGSPVSLPEGDLLDSCRFSGVIFKPSGLMLQISSGAWPSGLGVSAESCNEVHVELECVPFI